MARILCVGNAVLDLVFTVPHHPAADEELRAASLRVAAGGNAANTARVLRALGHEVSLGAVLADHPAGAPLEEELRRTGVDLSPCRRVAGMPSLSAVLIPQDGAHRTIVHHGATPEYDREDFARLDLSRWRWAHFESRPGEGTVRMVRHARRFAPDLLLSLEAEKLRAGIEEAFPLARLVLFSRGYAEAAGAARPVPFLQDMRARVPHSLLAVAWGAEGAWGIEADGTLLHEPASPPARVVDTLGAGDSFNAGMIGALAAGKSLRRALGEACRLAGRKVGQIGFDGLSGP
ncbi:MAG TPA: PfkB family carbohydrate kinase [Candidatus Methanoperedens sp.]|nr:PfkB family carbohydrate kinase [Candidatus Methanoperedens sp.]